MNVTPNWSEAARQCRTETAFHEAGHAVVLVHYQRAVSTFILDLDTHQDFLSGKLKKDDLPFLGRCETVFDDGGKRARRLGSFQKRVYSIAGPLAQLVAESRDYLDYPDAIWFEVLENAVAAGEQGENSLDIPTDCRSDELYKAAREAMRIIRHRLSELQTIAVALMERGIWFQRSYEPLAALKGGAR